LNAEIVIRIGVLTPHAAVGPEEELPAMAPGRVVVRVGRVSFDAAASGAASAPTSPAALRSSTTAPYLEEALHRLGEPVDAIGYASTTAAYAIGFGAETAMVSRLAALARGPVVATCASAVSAFRVLQVERIALIGAPWFEPVFNELGVAYFRSQGFEVVSSASAELSQSPAEIEPAAVRTWISNNVVDDAEAVFIGGNGFRATGAIDALEADLGRPVLTANQVLLWGVLGRAAPGTNVNGFGRLFAHTPPEQR
jgi:maleate isomerase